jgi:Ca2+-binding RTX toxin-like protein
LSREPGAVHFGYDGGDTLLGSGQAVSIYGGEGDDYLEGEPSFWSSGSGDYLAGEGGNDGIFGGPGNDTILGGPGNDDVLYGGAGDDLMQGDGDNDYIVGAAGNDTSGPWR